MSQQTINVGAAPNDGTGTPLRTSFQYCNSNFTELYNALGGGTGLPGASTQVIFNDGGTNLAGDAGMTYNKTTDTLSLVNLILSGNTTLGDAQSDTVTINGQVAARQGELASAIRAAASDYGAVSFDGATTSTRIVSASQAIGTGDFSLWSRFRVPTSFANNPGVLWLSDSSTATFRANSFGIYLDSGSGGRLRVFRYGTTAATDSRIATVDSFLSNYSGQIVDIVATRSGNTLKIYINGVDTTYTETTGGAAPAWGQTIVSDFAIIGAQSSSTIFSGRIFRAVVFNRALSASDALEVGITGINPADQWGTQTQIVGYNPAVLNGGFETNSLNASGTWSASTLGTSTATIDTSGSFSRTGTNAGKFTLDGSASFASFVVNNAANLMSIGKRYRISFWSRKGASSGSCGVQYGPVGGTNLNTGFTLTTTYANFVSEYVQDGSQQYNISRYAGSAASSEIYIDDVEITRIGAIIDLDFTVGAGYQATDRSSNALHGTMFNGVEFSMPKRMAVLYATTNTNGNQQMLGTLAIPTNAIIEDIIVNSTGSATVSVGNASAGTQIVNGAAVVSGRQKLTIATPFSTTGNLWVNSSSTATLQFTILYTIAS